MRLECAWRSRNVPHLRLSSVGGHGPTVPMIQAFPTRRTEPSATSAEGTGAPVRQSAATCIHPVTLGRVEGGCVTVAQCTPPVTRPVPLTMAADDGRSSL